jgi:hypothetical protein
VRQALSKLGRVWAEDASCFSDIRKMEGIQNVVHDTRFALRPIPCARNALAYRLQTAFA